jgi:hypothetical protein
MPSSIGARSPQFAAETTLRYADSPHHRFRLLEKRREIGETRPSIVVFSMPRVAGWMRATVLPARRWRDNAGEAFGAGVERDELPTLRMVIADQPRRVAAIERRVISASTTSSTGALRSLPTTDRSGGPC